ncbi:RNA-binding protein [Anaeramoeba flamelloides]|uniref:RNA-binding protein n=1 Tax=Anaeramoeba flamelloides TaxID=1746091 RepID=A0AAV8AFU6_9EUKA|nr:RNA-binding protein [Anaeramoeba flamelloides]
MKLLKTVKFLQTKKKKNNKQKEKEQQRRKEREKRKDKEREKPKEKERKKQSKTHQGKELSKENKEINKFGFDTEVLKVFRKVGDVYDVFFPKGKKGFFFVQYRTKKTAEKAVKTLNESNFKGRTIAVDMSYPKQHFERKMKQFQNLQKKKEKEDEEKKEKETKKGKGKGKGNEKEEEEEEEEPDNGESDDSDEGTEEDEEEMGSVSDSISDSGSDSDSDFEQEELDYEEIKKKKNEERNLRTLFLRNLTFEATPEDLKKEFGLFGEVESALIVKDKVTQKPTGSAFVTFKTVEASNVALERGQVKTRAGGNKEGENEKNLKWNRKTFVSDLFSQSGITILGRTVRISRALSRTGVKKLEDDKKLKEQESRNLHLAEIGEIKPDDPLFSKLSKNDRKKREKARQAKIKKLKNEKYFVSKTRLSVRNLPKRIDEISLKQIFESVLERKKKGKNQNNNNNGKSKQNKVLKVNIVQRPEGDSSRFGFVLFKNHNEALTALKKTNNNPNIFGENQRLIVEFSIEDQRKIDLL